MGTNVLYNMIIDAVDFDLAAEMGRIIDIDQRGDKTFTIPLSPSGELPTTHWGCRTYMTPQTKGMLISSTAQQLKTILDTVADSRNRPKISHPLDNWPRSLILDEGDFYELIESMGLKRIDNV